MLDQEFNSPSTHGVPARHPRAAVQRQRAAGLRAVALQIDSDVIARLDHLAIIAAANLADSGRGRLCLAMLNRHLDQLHAVVDELRDVAFRCTADADQIERSGGGPARHGRR